MIIVGEGALSGTTAKDVLALSAQIASDNGALSEEWNGFAVLHNAAGRVGGLDVGFVPERGGMDAAKMQAAAKKGDLDVVFLLGADNYDLSAYENAFVVYIGSHGDRGAHAADVILPGSAYTEKSVTYVNTAGTVQRTNRAVFGPGEAKEDWAILRALSAHLGATLPFDNLNQLRAAMFAEVPHLAVVEGPVETNANDVAKLAKVPAKIKPGALVSPIDDFYLTNPIARASKVMAECSQLALGQVKEAAE